MELWIARDKNNSLHLYEEKPFINHLGVWTDEHINHSHLYSALFPEITYENSPRKVKIELV